MRRRPPRIAAERLWSRDLVLVVAASFLAFGAFGISLPVLPRYVVEELGRGDATAGFVFGSFAIAAILVRPFVGRWGDRRGRRRLMVIGAALMVIGLLAHVPAATVTTLVMARLVLGVGQAALVVGAATMTLDLAPTGRQGEASSYSMVAVQVGLGLGPVAGELVLDVTSYAVVWLVSAGIAFLSGLVTLAVTPDRGHPDIASVRGVAGFFHRAGLAPGVILALGMTGFVGFLAFVPLYADQIGVQQAAPLFLLASLTIAGVRLVGARLPDRFGPVRTATIALLAAAVGLVGLGLWATPAGLYLMTFAMAVGTALVVPSLLLAAVQGVPVHERSRVMATFTSFIDVAGALGPLLLGAVATVSSYGGAFITAAVACLIATVLVRAWLTPALAARVDLSDDRPADAPGA
jgi:MFS family permease